MNEDKQRLAEVNLRGSLMEIENGKYYQRNFGFRVIDDFVKSHLSAYFQTFSLTFLSKYW